MFVDLPHFILIQHLSNIKGNIKEIKSLCLKYASFLKKFSESCFKNDINSNLGCAIQGMPYVEGSRKLQGSE